MKSSTSLVMELQLNRTFIIHYYASITLLQSLKVQYDVHTVRAKITKACYCMQCCFLLWQQVPLLTQSE